MLASAAVSGRAVADESEKTPPQTVGQIVEKFFDENKTCIDLTDGCSVCTRQWGEVTCSTPAIACISHELQCTREERPPAKDDGR